MISLTFSLSDKGGAVRFSMLFINSFRGIMYIGHSRRKCISSSILSGQKGQNLFSLGVIGDECLPFSMLRTWFERRYFVNDCLTLVFFLFCTGIFASFFTYCTRNLIQNRCSKKIESYRISLKNIRSRKCFGGDER